MDLVSYKQKRVKSSIVEIISPEFLKTNDTMD